MESVSYDAIESSSANAKPRWQKQRNVFDQAHKNELYHVEALWNYKNIGKLSDVTGCGPSGSYWLLYPHLHERKEEDLYEWLVHHYSLAKM
jgi:hypothetical protein